MLLLINLGRLGRTIPLGRYLGRHYHQMGPARTQARIRRMDHGSIQALENFFSLFEHPPFFVVRLIHGK